MAYSGHLQQGGNGVVVANYIRYMQRINASITGMPFSLKTSHTELFPVAMPPVTPAMNMFHVIN